MDQLTFSAPARIKALVVPAGLLKAQEFHNHFERLCEASEVPLIDVHLPVETHTRTTNDDSGGDSTGNKNTNVSSKKDYHKIFDPSDNPTGRVAYSFETSLIDPSQKALLDLEPWRQQFLTIGIAHSHGITEELRSIVSDLRKLHPSALYHVVLVFGVTEASEDWPADVFPILISKVTSLESTISTVTGKFLAHLSVFWTARQLNSFQSPAVLLSQQGRRTTHRSSNSSVSFGRHGSISVSTTERAKSRQDGRTRKFLGSLYLLSGRITNALSELGASTLILKETGDSLWHGTALREIALCLVILSYDKVPCQIPLGAVSSAWSMALQKLKEPAKRPPHSSGVSSIASTTVSGSTSATKSNRAAQSHEHSRSNSETGSVGNLSTASSPRSSMQLSRTISLRKSKPFTENTPPEEIVEFIIAAALEDFAVADASEAVPHNVYYESIVRYVSLLINLRYGGGWKSKALSSALRGPPLTSGSGNYPSLFTIEQWITKVYTVGLKKLEPDIQVLILGSVARLYSRAGLRRKWAFTCAQIVTLLASSSATVHTDLGHLEDVLLVYTVWPNLQAQMLRKLAALGQRIKNPKLQTEAANRLLAMACFSKFTMMDKEQLTLYHLIRSYGDVVQSQFWDPEIVRSVFIKSRRLTTVRSSKVGSNEIIYDPFEGTVTKEEESIESGIPTAAKITLRNPLSIDLQLFELVLVDSKGIKVSETIGELTIPAKTFKFKLEVAIVPSSNQSKLEVSGCQIQVRGCSSQIYTIPKIEIPITPARPVLVLQELSLSKGWTMLLEGERKTFFIILWNSSQTPSKILHFGFNDSTVDTLRTATAKHDLSRVEYYEYEYYLHKCRAINLRELTKNITIPPQSSQKFEFDLVGKRGVSSAAVLVDYGLNEDSLRRLKIPLQVTIYPSITVERVTILPSTKIGSLLLILDMRNAWREQLTCRIWADDGKPVEHKIGSQSSHRFLVDVPWNTINSEELKKPIPSLTSRQYTVDTRTSVEQLEMFWLREKFISKLHGEWFNEKDRSGYIEFRMIQLSRRMADALKISSVDVTASSAKQGKVDEPLKIRISVSNKSAKPVQGMLRIIANKPAQRYMQPLGALQQLITIKSGEQTNVDFEMVFLNQGPYELSSVLDPIPGTSITEAVFQSHKTFVHIEN